jgi:hypothetical protein
MSKSFDFSVSEGRDAMLGRRRLGMSVRLSTQIQSLPGMFVPRQMLLLTVLFRDPMGVGSAVVQLGG